MIEFIPLPHELERFIGSESKDFTVKADRSHPLKMSLFMILFGGVWLAFTSIFFIAFLGPLFSGQEVHMTVNDVPTVAGPGNLGPITAPAIIIGIFTLVGLLVLGFGIRSAFQKGGYFVGTPLRLIHYHRNKFRSIDWEQFSGDITVRGKDRKGSITLGMRTGKMVSSKNGPDRYVPDTLYITGIPHVFEIEQVCRKRIKENDPTPVNR